MNAFTSKGPEPEPEPELTGRTKDIVRIFAIVFIIMGVVLAVATTNLIFIILSVIGVILFSASFAM